MLSTRTTIARKLLNPTSKSIRAFHPTTANMVKAGDSIPNVDLVEGSPGDKVNLSKELASGKGLIIGVPAAYSKYTLASSTLASFIVVHSSRSVQFLLTNHQARLAQPLISLATSAMTSLRMLVKSSLSQSMTRSCE